MTAMATSRLSRVTLPGGLGLQYAERGRGPAILFLHGFGDSWYSFDAVMRRLPGDMRALAPTQRGHGDSDRPAAGYGIEDLAADARAFMDTAGVASAVVVGHSMGSIVAQELALGHPERVSRLVLVGSGTEFDNPTVRELAAAIGELRDPVSREFVREFQAGCVHRPIPDEVFDAIVAESLKLPARVWQAVIPGILARRPGRRLAELRMPTLIVWGEHDAICPRVEQKRLHEAITGSTLAIYAETAHAPNWEQPDRFTEDLLAFVRGRPVAGTAAARE